MFHFHIDFAMTLSVSYLQRHLPCYLHRIHFLLFFCPSIPHHHKTTDPHLIMTFFSFLFFVRAGDGRVLK